MPVTINGDGTITGYTPPIADGSITTAKLANGAASGSKLTMPSGSVLQTKVTQYDNASGAIAASGDTLTTVSQLALSITPTAANSKFFLTCTGVNGHCNMGGSAGNHGCRYYYYQSVNGGSYVNVDGTGNYSNPICSTHINGDIGSWSDYPVNYSYLAAPSYTLGQTIVFRPAFAKDISMGNSFTYYFLHNTNGAVASFIVQEIAA
tara:strand:- start:142 stop:759 length:618 start_codon:yes stop_codon:yes gene_type:complete